MQWRTRAGDEIAARLGEPLTKDMTAQALRTALDPGGAWMPSVLAAADKRLTEVRRHVPDAGGLVIATDQDSARAYAAAARGHHGREARRRALRRVGGRPSGSPAFSEGDAPWMVAVRMVSEGVDVPRLAVGRLRDHDLYAAVLRPGGRPVRACAQAGRDRVGVPSVGADSAGSRSEMEVERDHALGRRINDEDDLFAAENALLAQANAEEGASGDELGSLRGDGLGGTFRPGALRRRRVRS